MDNYDYKYKVSKNEKSEDTVHEFVLMTVNYA